MDWNRLKEIGTTLLGVLVMVVIYGGIGLYIFSVTPKAPNPDEVVCETVAIPHGNEVIKTSQEAGVETVETQGSDGQEKVCKKGTEIVSREVITQPVTHVMGIGSIPSQEWDAAMEEADAYYEEQGGAICMDGWRSYSTGRGTCSHHGGVAQWL